MPTDVRPKQFTVDDYHRMGEAGILEQGDRLELIRGQIVEMSPTGRPHGTCVNFLTEFLVRRLQGKRIVNIQNPVRLDKRSEPRPDVVLTATHEDASSDGFPAASGILVVMEVADTTLRYDRDVKLPLYAAAGIPEAWIIDLPGQAVERHTKPVEGSYRMVARAARGEALDSSVLPDVSLTVDEVLGA